MGSGFQRVQSGLAGSVPSGLGKVGHHVSENCSSHRGREQKESTLYQQDTSYILFYSSLWDVFVHIQNWPFKSLPGIALKDVPRSMLYKSPRRLSNPLMLTIKTRHRLWETSTVDLLRHCSALSVLWKCRIQEPGRSVSQYSACSVSRRAWV